ncbi:hypothetical protein [Kitasatospora sp. NPDC093806]|uniref:hypothetical protein n=1 Tax=Kitasatospora sp. NPDC093806 TaxID=3155075 RepID=UPI003417F51D
MTYSPSTQTPSAEQLRDLRSFITLIERQASIEPRAGGRTSEIARSWSQLAQKYSNLIVFAERSGHAEEARRAWVVVVDLLRPWARSEDLPESLREAVAAASEAPLDPWA